jgi:magnesium-transporting ATPase (P-type)
MLNVLTKVPSILVYSSYVVGTILPPLLPTVFTVSVGISENRLATQRIATVNAESILIAGKVTRAFFDKTGTLTKQGLDFLSARSSKSWTTGDAVCEDLGRAMACCHNLTKSQTGVLVGNPVDITMFSVSGATSFETKANASIIVDRSGKKSKIVRKFDFDHQRMTQGVILELADGSYLAVVKGSGESIQKICLADTLPDDFDTVLRDSARAGIYQISVASKPVKADNVSDVTRDEVECSLIFVGVLNFQNVMREDTPDVIRQLEEGEVHCIMLTGDSVQTGIQVSQESGIMVPGKNVVIGSLNSAGEVVWSNDATGDTATVPSTAELTNGSTQLAMSGAAFDALCTKDPSEAARILQHVRVFGRCTPRHKVFVVDCYVNLGFITMMCGDGGNDCGALKAAHVGVALSDAEASIVAPFTALDKNISSVLDVLKEGRCALFSALSSYKFIIMYGQIETVNQIINAYFVSDIVIV